MITCYLDSQDYSSLTDPKLDNPENRRIKDTLLHLARTKQVCFAFSAAAVCESAPLTADATHLAELKGEFLSDLCGSNALVSFDRLVRLEASALAQKLTPPKDIIDPQGQWFPEIPVDDEPEQLWDRMLALAEKDMKSMGLSRQERRTRCRALVKNGKPRELLITQLSKQDSTAYAAELIKEYPMHPQQADTMVRYFLGRATERDFNEALTNSLKDPRFMMKWFTTQHALSSPIADLVRKPGQELGQLMRSMINISAQFAGTLQDAGIDANPTGKGGEITRGWLEMVKRQLVAIVGRIATSNKIELGEYDAQDVDTFCPGISTGVRSLYSSVWANIGEGRKEIPTDSQPVDALHALYAPYIQIFRADRFMAHHIRKQVNSRGTVVVSRLPLLIPTLNEKLS